MFTLLNQRRDFEQELTKHRLQLDDNLSIPVSFVSAIQMGADLNLKKRSLEIAFLLYRARNSYFFCDLWLYQNNLMQLKRSESDA